MREGRREGTYGIRDVGGGDDVRVEEEGEDLDDGVEVEEEEDFFPACPRLSVPQRRRKLNRERRTDGGVLCADVEDHDDGHDERDEVHKDCCYPSAPPAPSESSSHVKVRARSAHSS